MCVLSVSGDVPISDAELHCTQLYSVNCARYNCYKMSNKVWKIRWNSTIYENVPFDCVNVCITPSIHTQQSHRGTNIRCYIFNSAIYLMYYIASFMLQHTGWILRFVERKKDRDTTSTKEWMNNTQKGFKELCVKWQNYLWLSSSVKILWQERCTHTRRTRHFNFNKTRIWSHNHLQSIMRTK